MPPRQDFRVFACRVSRPPQSSSRVPAQLTCGSPPLVYTIARLCWRTPASSRLRRRPLAPEQDARDISDTSEFVQQPSLRPASSWPVARLPPNMRQPSTSKTVDARFGIRAPTVTGRMAIRSPVSIWAARSSAARCPTRSWPASFEMASRIHRCPPPTCRTRRRRRSSQHARPEVGIPHERHHLGRRIDDRG